MSKKIGKGKEQKSKNRQERNSSSRFPIRMCIGCGKKQDKWTLTRFVLDETGSIILDHRMTRPGRGAYICDDPGCWKSLIKDERLCSAFRVKEIQRMPLC